MQKTLAIIMPVHNEGVSLYNLVQDWESNVVRKIQYCELIMINDGSDAVTTEILNDLKSKYSNLTVINKPNSGHGPSCIYGYNYALAHNFQYIFQTDSDGQTFSGDFWKFWDKRTQHAFIFGYRPNRADGQSRVFFSKLLAIIIRLVFGTFVKDANVPFRLMSSSKLKTYVPLIPQNFFLANALLTILLEINHEDILWQDIVFQKRAMGRSSYRLKTLLPLGMRVIKDFIMYKRYCR